jgi:hypothetical protein
VRGNAPCNGLQNLYSPVRIRSSPPPPLTLRRRAALTIALFALALGQAAPALACSPPFEEPTIAALGPDQVVVVGTTGAKVDGGRLFHVERWFNPGPAQATIVIAFKEGEPVGDCSYPVAEGQRMIIAPAHDQLGVLSADLGTLQADPATEIGRRYVAEAEALYGPGVVPEPTVVADPGPDAGMVALVVAAIVVLAGGMWLAFRR